MYPRARESFPCISATQQRADTGDFLRSEQQRRTGHGSLAGTAAEENDFRVSRNPGREPSVSSSREIRRLKVCRETPFSPRSLVSAGVALRSSSHPSQSGLRSPGSFQNFRLVERRNAVIEASPHQCGKRDTGEDTVGTLERNPPGASRWATTPVRAFVMSFRSRVVFRTPTLFW